MGIETAELEHQLSMVYSLGKEQGLGALRSMHLSREGQKCCLIMKILSFIKYLPKQYKQRVWPPKPQRKKEYEET
jgi:hypothetical protein